MTKVYIEDFNPKSGCWNRIKVVDEADFDPSIIYTSKYGGLVRVRYEVIGRGEITESEVQEETFEKDEESFSLTNEKSDDTVEENEESYEYDRFSTKKFFG